jgi:phytoene desaturase
MSRAVVIGGGVGGMATAMRLSALGHDVTLLEASHRLGGKVARVERDGFVFDTGPSLLTLPAVYRELFNVTGGSFDDAVDLQALDIAFGYHWADGATADLPGVDPGRISAALGAALGNDAERQWRAFIERAGLMWQITRRPFLESPLEGAGTLLRLARDPADIRTIAPWSSLRSLGRGYFDDPRLVTLLDRYATYTGSDPRRAPAALATVPYVEQVFGAWHLGGGITTLADALARRCRELGVDVCTGIDVAEVVTDRAGVTGVRSTVGEAFAADIVVANADATHLYRDLVSDQRADSARRRLGRATPSLSGFVILVATRGRTEGVRHHNVWFPEDYDAEFDDIFGRRARRVADPTIYACVPDDDAMRPDADHESWFILVNAPRHGAGPGCIDWDSPGIAESYADHVLSVLAERGVDLRARQLWREVRTPADLERATRAPGGSIYGSSSNGARAAFLRPANISPVPGLYLVGGSAHPGGGLPLVGLSAQIVAEAIGTP